MFSSLSTSSSSSSSSSSSNAPNSSPPEPAAANSSSSTSTSSPEVAALPTMDIASSSIDGPPAAAAAAAAPAATDPQYLAYSLEAAALLHNLGTLHHDRGTGGADDAMRSYSESIQIRIRAQDVSEASARRAQLRLRQRQQQQQQQQQQPQQQQYQQYQPHLIASVPPADAADGNNDGDRRPTLDEMALHLTHLRARTAELRRSASHRRAEAGDAYVYPHDVPASLRRGETAMVGLNAFTRPLLLPVSDGFDPRLPGHGFVSSVSYPFQAQAAVGGGAAATAATTATTAAGGGWTMNAPACHTSGAAAAGATAPPPRRRGGLKRTTTPSSHLINHVVTNTNTNINTAAAAAATTNTNTNPHAHGYQPQPHHTLGCTPYTSAPYMPCHAVSCCDPTILSSEVQKVNSLAAFTLYNIGLLHQADRSHKEARESYEIANTMLQTIPPHLGQRTTVPLLAVMLRNNLGCVAYRTDQLEAASEHFQLASNTSLDLSLLYAPTAAMAANPTLESEGMRASRRRLGRSNVAILCNLSLTWARMGQLQGDRHRHARRHRQDALDVANAALQLSTRMEEDARQYREAMAATAASANGSGGRSSNSSSNLPRSSTTTTTPADDNDDGLDLTILPYVRGRAHHGLSDAAAAMEQYRSFLSAVERSGHRSSHPYSVAAMQQILTLRQSDALAAVEEMLRRVGDGHTAAAA